MREVSVGILGAGAIGCWLGGKLAASGADVRLIGRERQRAELANGLELTDMGGVVTRATTLKFGTEAAELADRDVVLCCVKSGQTVEAAAVLAAHLTQPTVVVSMQNGIQNAPRLRAALPGHLVLAGIVGFNVLTRGEGRFRRATTGPLVVEYADDPRVAGLERALARAHLSPELSRDIVRLQWAKLVLNLNNGVSALSGATTRELLDTAGYRRIIAHVMRESLAVMRAAGVRPARLGNVPVHLFPIILGLPTTLLRWVARAQLDIDPEARSSMWEDLERRRPTEVDALNGEIVRLADGCGASAPINRRFVELVHEVEVAGAGSPRLDPGALARALGIDAVPLT